MSTFCTLILYVFYCIHMRGHRIYVWKSNNRILNFIDHPNSTPHEHKRCDMYLCFCLNVLCLLQQYDTQHIVVVGTLKRQTNRHRQRAVWKSGRFEINAAKRVRVRVDTYRSQICGVPAFICLKA